MYLLNFIKYISYAYTDWCYELVPVEGLSSVLDVIGSKTESKHLETASLGSVEVTCGVIQHTSLWREAMSHSMFFLASVYSALRSVNDISTGYRILNCQFSRFLDSRTSWNL